VALTPTQAALVEEHIPLAYKHARSLHRSLSKDTRARIERDDIEGAALLVLCEIAVRYDPSVGPFENYASSSLRRRCIDAIRYKLGKDLRRSAGDFPADTTLPADIVLTEDRAVADEFADAELEAGLAQALTEQQRFIVECRMADIALWRIGEMLGVSESRVCQLIRYDGLGAKVRGVLREVA
jgi:RNA polymerase sigma factor (sigma-70 family)